MEERKLIKFGKSAYCVTIPPSWLRKNNLLKGDIIYIQETLRNSLEISPLSSSLSVDEDHTIDIGGLGPDEIFQKLYLAYINGYSSIILEGKNSGKVPSIREHLHEFIGAEVMEVTSERIVINIFWDAKKINVDSIIRRVGQNTKSLFEDMVVLIDSDMDMEDLIGKKFEIRRQVLLARRALNYSLSTITTPDSFRYSIIEIVHLSNIVFLFGIIGEQLISVSKILDSLKSASSNMIDDTMKMRFRNVLENLHDQYGLMIQHYMDRKDVSFTESDSTMSSLLTDLSSKNPEVLIIMSYFQMIGSKLREIRSLIQGVRFASDNINEAVA